MYFFFLLVLASTLIMHLNLFAKKALAQWHEQLRGLTSLTCLAALHMAYLYSTSRSLSTGRADKRITYMPNSWGIYALFSGIFLQKAHTMVGLARLYRFDTGILAVHDSLDSRDHVL